MGDLRVPFFLFPLPLTDSAPSGASSYPPPLPGRRSRESEADHYPFPLRFAPRLYTDTHNECQVRHGQFTRTGVSLRCRLRDPFSQPVGEAKASTR